MDPARWALRKVRDNFPVPMDWRREECQLWEAPPRPDGGSPDWFIENQYFFGSRFQAYGDGDDVEQFVLFCRAALQACRLEGWIPDVIHAHDWHTGAAIRLEWASSDRAGLVFTIHNLAHRAAAAPRAGPCWGSTTAGAT